MPPRKRDLSFEALVHVTNTNIAIGRGKVNIALSAIRDAWRQEGGLEEDLPREIELRAAAYKYVMPGMMLTPTALATHWHRCMAQKQVKSQQQQLIDDLKKATE